MGYFRDPMQSPNSPFRQGRVTKEERSERKEKREKMTRMGPLNVEANDISRAVLDGQANSLFSLWKSILNFSIFRGIFFV